MDAFTKKVLVILNDYIKEKYRGNVSAAQEGLGLAPDKSVFHRWLKALNERDTQARIPRLDSIGAIMDKLGVQALTPAERAELRFAENENPAAEGTTDSKRIRELEAEIAELLQYKYKWEAALELSGKKTETTSQKKGNIA